MLLLAEYVRVNSGGGVACCFGPHHRKARNLEYRIDIAWDFCLFVLQRKLPEPTYWSLRTFNGSRTNLKQPNIRLWKKAGRNKRKKMPQTRSQRRKQKKDDGEPNNNSEDMVVVEEEGCESWNWSDDDSNSDDSDKTLGNTDATFTEQLKNYFAVDDLVTSIFSTQTIMLFRQPSWKPSHMCHPMDCALQRPTYAC